MGNIEIYQEKRIVFVANNEERICGFRLADADTYRSHISVRKVADPDPVGRFAVPVGWVVNPVGRAAYPDPVRIFGGFLAYL